MKVNGLQDVKITTMADATDRDYLEKDDYLEFRFEDGFSTRGKILLTIPQRIYRSSTGNIRVNFDKFIEMNKNITFDIYGKNKKGKYGIIAYGKTNIVFEATKDEPSERPNKIAKPRKNILKTVFIGIGIAAAIVAVFAIGVLLYKFGARLPIDKISGLLRNCNAALPRFGGGNFGVTNHIYQMPSSRMPVNRHGGIYKGRIWQMDMNYIPKSANDPVKPMTQRELIKWNFDLIKNDMANVMPKRKRKKVVKIYEKLLKNDKVNIPFKLNISGESEPDFSKVSYEMVKIRGTSNRYNKRGEKGNMSLASGKCSKKWHLLQKDFDKWRNDHKLVWHEAKNGKIYLVPHSIHANVQHEGLIAHKKKSNNV